LLKLLCDRSSKNPADGKDVLLSVFVQQGFEKMSANL